MKLKEETRKNYNRAITVLVFGMFCTSWVLINSGEFLLPAVLYVGLGLISTVLYLVWNYF